MPESPPPAPRGLDLVRQLLRDVERRKLELEQENAARATGATTPLEAPSGAAVLAPQGAGLMAPESAYDVALREVMRHAREVTSILDLDALLECVLQAFVSITGAERGCLLMIDENDKLEFRAGLHLTNDVFSSHRHAISHGAVRDAAHSGRSVFVEDVLRMGPMAVRESVEWLGLRSYNSVPLVAAGRVLGVCYSDSKAPGQLLAERQRTLLEEFAAQAALAIENARRHGALVAAKNRLEAENEGLRRQIDRQTRFGDLVGESAAMQQVFAMVDKVAGIDATVLLLGETGSGKELLARAIHANSLRRSESFVTVDLTTVPAPLLESTLFGHRRGSFTGATENRPGLFSLADRGTLFLDEIGEMPLDLQQKLLRALQEREIRALGASKVQAIDVRVIAATNRNLEQEVEAKRFREDLYYRLHVVPIHVPPLRERGADALLLAHSFATRYAQKYKKGLVSIAPDAQHYILSHSWPGNVRELEHSVERAVALSEPNSPLTAALMRSSRALPEPAAWKAKSTLHDIMTSVERDAVRQALEQCGGKVTLAAKQLDISRQYLHTLIRKHRLTNGEGD